MPASESSDAASRGPADRRVADHWLSRTLRLLTHVSARNPRATLCVVLLTVCASVAYAVGCLNFHTDRADLIDPQAEYHQRWLDYTKSFGEQTDIVIVVAAGDAATMHQVQDELGTRLQQEASLFQDVFFKIDSRSLHEKGLQYFTPKQLYDGLVRLNDYAAVVGGRWERSRLDQQFQELAGSLKTRTVDPVQGIDDRTLHQLERVQALVTGLNAALENTGGFDSPWPRIIPATQDLSTADVTYLGNESGSLGFVQVRPAVEGQDKLTGATAAVDRIRELIADVQTRYPTAEIGVTGIPVLENDEMRKSQSDMLTASLISFVAVATLLFVGFRGVKHPLIAMIMLLVGMAWTFGYTTFAVGHLNILSVSFAVILIGLGIDFAIHYLSRYLELRQHGRELRPALKETSRSVGTGIVTAAVTTALAFFCATFTDFLGVAELGIIAGGGILICALATFLVLPALVGLADKDTPAEQLPTPFTGDWFRRWTTGWPRITAVVSIVLIGVAATQVVQWNSGRPAWGIAYDPNLLNLQAEGVDSVAVQQRVFRESGRSLLYAVSIADSPEEARQLRQNFEALPSVARVEDLASRLPAYSSEQTKPYIEAFRTRLARLPVQTPNVGLLNPAVVGRLMEDTLAEIRGIPHPEARTAESELNTFLDRFETLDQTAQTKFLGEFQARATGALYLQLRTIAAATNTAPLTWAELPSELKQRYVSDDGHWLLQVFPKEQVWDAAPLASFVKELRSVDENITGTPLQNHEASRQIQTSYQNASLYALAVIVLVLLLDFLDREHKALVLLPPFAVMVFAAMMLQTRRIEVNPVFLIGAYLVMVTASAAILDFPNLRDALLAMFPPLVGGLMMFGIFGFAGIALNPANMIVLPLVLGIGVDDGVHVIHDYRSQRGTYRTSSSTMNAILLTSLTTMVGFGSMLVAAHRGLFSIGVVLVIGVGCCLFVSLVTLPALLTLLSNSEKKRVAIAGSVSDHHRDEQPRQRPQNKRRAA